MVWWRWLVLPLLLAGCSRSPIAQAKAQFVGSCRAEGAAKAVCSCVFDQLATHYGTAQMLRLGQAGMASLPPDFPDVAARSVLRCRE